MRLGIKIVSEIDLFPLFTRIDNANVRGFDLKFLCFMFYYFENKPKNTNINEVNKGKK